MIEFERTKNNDYRFLVKSDSGKTLLKSVLFDSKASMESSISIFKESKATPIKLFERKTNTEGKFLIELKNNKGQTIGSSGLYTSEAGMENGILNIVKSLKSEFN